MHCMMNSATTVGSILLPGYANTCSLILAGPLVPNRSNAFAVAWPLGQSHIWNREAICNGKCPNRMWAKHPTSLRDRHLKDESPHKAVWVRTAG